MKDTIPLQARKGRASYLGERSIGHQDPGATSSYLILNALLEAIGAVSYTHLDVYKRQVVGRPLADVVRLPPELVTAIDAGDEFRDVEVSLQALGRDVRCVVTLRPIFEAGAQPVSYVALLSPIEHVRQIAQQQYGAQTGLSIEDIQADSPGMRRVVRQSRTAARGAAPVLILSLIHI